MGGGKVITTVKTMKNRRDRNRENDSCFGGRKERESRKLRGGGRLGVRTDEDFCVGPRLLRRASNFSREPIALSLFVSSERSR